MNTPTSRVCKPFFLSLAAALLLAGSVAAAIAQTADPIPDPLKAGFEHPDNPARPRVWWHWMNGNITEEGIKLDLEWMHRIGLGGFQSFDAALATPQVVDHRLVYMTPEWDKAFLYATKLGESLGMEEGIASSPGWSETGGPWVPPAEGMKKYVWSELRVSGGQPLPGPLPHPPTSSGPFQNLAIHDFMASPNAKPVPDFYADAAVIAFPQPQSDMAMAELKPEMSASAGRPEFAKLGDGDLVTTTGLPIPAKGAGNAWIQYDFHQPRTMRALTAVVNSFDQISSAVLGVTNPDLILESSDDGVAFRAVATLSLGGAPEYTLAFSPVTARYFRIEFKPTPPPPMPSWLAGLDLSAIGMAMPPRPTDYKIAELKLTAGARVNRFEEKAAFIPVSDLYSLATPPVSSGDAVQKAAVVDLTAKLRPDGSLDWTPPAGEWVILRFGYSLTGITNHPATEEATGLEVDKMDRGAVKRYMDTYLDSYTKAVGSENMGQHGIQFVVTDSWEAGAQNWTASLMDEFTRRRGYDPRPWMPVLAGYVVQSSADSDHFLWDFRKTIADLHADVHYGQVQASLQEHGLGHYGESHESGRALIADGMEVKKLDDIPMSAMWVQTPGVYDENYGYDADDRESASVAHIYGRKFVAAESLTAAAAPWAWTPSSLRPVADQELLNGINRFVIHESAHQPLVGKAPGLTLGPFGQWFNRNETWAEEAGPWIDYLARGSFLMQQGHFAADVLYFYGEDSNLTAIFNSKAPDVPAGYGFDYVNADALLHEFSVSGGRIVTKTGMSYRVLALDPYSQHMSLPVLRAIHRLVEAGAVVAGPKPVDDTSLADDQAAFQAMNQELFGDGSGVHTVGKGKVYAGESLSAVFAAMRIAPDFDYTKPVAETRVAFAHRSLPDADIYFVDNRTHSQSTFDATFRVQGKAPEIWHAETGKSEPVSYRIAADRTTIPLTLEPWGSVFVVFRKAASGKEKTLPETKETELTSVGGAWSVQFQPGWGAPPSVEMASLASWTDNSDPGVRYFSGTATYTKTLTAPSAWFGKGERQVLDLGDVRELAEVSVNGKDFGVLWHAPFRVDITDALKPGDNRIEVKVTDTWVNRLIGDQQPDAKVKYTFADVAPYRAKSPLLPSGLLGPVRILGVGKP